MGEGEGGRFLSFSSLPFSLPSFPFSPETPDTQAIHFAPSEDQIFALNVSITRFRTV